MDTSGERLADLQLETSTENVRITADSQDKLDVLIMSEAGKLIYSYSKREDAITLMPLCTALMNYAQKTQNETLNSIQTSDDMIIDFITRSPLIIIVIHQSNSYVDSLVLVEQVEAQLISILTAKTLKSVFQDRPTFDLKRLIYGSEKFIDSILNLSRPSIKPECPSVQSFLAVTSSLESPTGGNNILMNSSNVLPIRPHRILIPIVATTPGARDGLQNMIVSSVSNSSKSMVFSLIFKVLTTGGDESSPNEEILEKVEGNDEANVANFQLITICNHHDRHKLKVADIHIILALLDGLKTQLASVESLWMPVCLPRFNQDAFLHSYISYIANSSYCLVMMSVDRDEFDVCQESKNKIEEKLNNLLKDPTQHAKINYQPSPLVHPVLLELQDKLTDKRLTDEELADVHQKSQIFNSKAELYHARQLQFLWYQTSKQVVWWQRSVARPMNSILYYITKKMLQSSLKTLWLKLSDDSTLLGWHVTTFQIYAQFDSSITSNEATEVIQRITNWIKKEEDNFSIKDYR